MSEGDLKTIVDGLTAARTKPELSGSSAGCPHPYDLSPALASGRISGISDSQNGDPGTNDVERPIVLSANALDGTVAGTARFGADVEVHLNGELIEIATADEDGNPGRRSIERRDETARQRRTRRQHSRSSRMAVPGMTVYGRLDLRKRDAACQFQN